MAILKIRDADGNVHEILAIKGKDGKDCVLTPTDKQEIANQVSASAQVLPPVNANDNGKFLKVINGAWGAVALNSAEEVAY